MKECMTKKVSVEQEHRRFCNIIVSLARNGAPKDLITRAKGHANGLRHAAGIVGIEVGPMQTSARRAELVCRKYEREAFQKLALPEMQHQRRLGSNLSN